jgi:pimeloyl-ACP methyl ester carboxylesterase
VVEMSMGSTRSQLFRAIIKPNPKATKVLFYLTSYAFPWWVYAVPIGRFRRMGYEVVVYDFNDALIKNEDPSILPKTIIDIVDDISTRRKEYQSRGVHTFHGIGNSLGSYVVFNYAIRYSLHAMVLNGGGSIADIIFHHKDGSWKKIANAYTQKGYDKQRLRELWAEYDLPTLGQKIKAEKVLITWSLNDGTIPRTSSEGFIAELKASGKQMSVKTDNLPHVLSVISNSTRVKSIYRFLNNH